jgi:hypothetical protein
MTSNTNWTSVQKSNFQSNAFQGDTQSTTLSVNGRPVFGSLHGLGFTIPTVASNACTLVAENINAPAYTGAAALAAELPAATAGAVCVFLFSADPAGGVAALTINCAGTDAFETGSVVPTTASNLFLYDVSTAGETALVFTPTNDTVNYMSHNSRIEFNCKTAGLWFVAHVETKHDIGVTAGAATGTLLFAA